jgi:hypothetical protein
MLRDAIRRRRPAMNAFDLTIRLRQPCGATERGAVAADAGRLLDGLLCGLPAPQR